MLMLSMLALLSAGSEPDAKFELRRVTFATSAVETWDAGASDTADTPAYAGDAVADALVLPTSAPSLPARGTGFSTLFRARDVLDIAGFPARATAKMYRLTDSGERQGTSCTAQFVGPRHLLTAAHCVIDKSAGRPHPGFEIALRYDAGREEGVVGVVRAWAPASEFEPMPAVIQADAPIDWAADCHDVALIEVAEPVGDRLGWLGMTSSAPDAANVHRFSYPNESSATILERMLESETEPGPLRDSLVADIAARKRTEPDFSPENLYYEHGPLDGVDAEALSERNGAVLPGRSGSALINADFQALGVMSRAVEGVNYSCRLTPELIGAFHSIAGTAGAP